MRYARSSQRVRNNSVEPSRAKPRNKNRGSEFLRAVSFGSALVLFLHLAVIPIIFGGEVVTFSSQWAENALSAMKLSGLITLAVFCLSTQFYLASLAATPIPVVMEKCTMCHSNYDTEQKGLVIGALTYRVPIDE